MWLCSPDPVRANGALKSRPLSTFPSPRARLLAPVLNPCPFCWPFQYCSPPATDHTFGVSPSSPTSPGPSPLAASNPAPVLQNARFLGLRPGLLPCPQHTAQPLGPGAPTPLTAVFARFLLTTFSDPLTPLIPPSLTRCPGTLHSSLFFFGLSKLLDPSRPPVLDLTLKNPNFGPSDQLPALSLPSSLGLWPVASHQPHLLGSYCVDLTPPPLPESLPLWVLLVPLSLPGRPTGWAPFSPKSLKCDVKVSLCNLPTVFSVDSGFPISVSPNLTHPFRKS